MMRDYKELVEQLRDSADWADHFAVLMGRGGDVHAPIMREAADAIEELSKPKWISVTERLPVERINPHTRDFEFVLCRTIWGDVRPFKYGTPIGQKKAHFWNGAGYVDAYVTHWMPLPILPSEG